ncbi:MAG: hypothetical protein ACTSX4_02595 [Candidatus Helarchaeota archaeon]
MTKKNKKKFTCKLCGKEFKMKQVGRIKLSKRLKKGEESIFFCSNCAKERIKIS